MTQEALKLALDALENHTAIKHPQQIHYRDKAITAIKEALAQEQEPVATLFGSLPVYNTTPPQRTWVGLTVNEIALINADYPLPQGFAQAIEAKLKELNT
jgi:hypothetical protein